MLCVDCGKEVPHVIGGSCPACFIEKTPLLAAPEVLDIELCAHCDARKVGAHWVDPKEGMPLEWIREDAVRGAMGVHALVDEPYLQFDERMQDERNYAYTARLEGTVEGVPLEDSRSLLVRQRRSVCDRCSRMYGNYYAAIVQLRATERDVTKGELERAHTIIGDELDRQRATGNRFSFLTKSGPMHGGWDYYLGDIEATRQVCRLLKQRLGATVQETAKLVGRREGEDVYRVTFLVRIRLYATGDFAATKGGRVLQVMGVNHGKVIGLDMATHQRTRVPEAGLRRVGGPDIVEDAILVSSSPSELQVMDPESFKTIDLLRPEGYEPGETVGVIRFEERLFLVPQANNL